VHTNDLLPENRLFSSKNITVSVCSGLLRRQEACCSMQKSVQQFWRMLKTGGGAEASVGKALTNRDKHVGLE
jgi:hypothetical protein